LESDPVAVDPASSVILTAAELLMQPPEWADFEPGVLISQEPSTDDAVSPQGAPQGGAVGEIDVELMNVRATVQPGDYSLSMLMVASGATTA
jgi:hypothetical protein